MKETPKNAIKEVKEDIRDQKKENRRWWASKSKGAKALFVIQIIVLLLGLIAFLGFIYCRPLFGDEFADEVLGKGVQTGWSLLGQFAMNTTESWILTIFTLGVASLIAFIFDIIIRLCSVSTRRGKTIGSLVRSLGHYAIVIITLGVILSVWGVNVTGIVAGVGVLTLIIGLGCQSLIQDVIGGLFIVFDDYFAVGDIVIIDGFRGTIEEVGLRTTKIKDAAGNIKAITNSSISTVTNLSRQDSLAKVSMDASYDEDVRRVEAIIFENLPKITTRIPGCTGPVSYKGINGFSDAGVTYFFIAPCKEADRFQVQRDLNREIYLLFVENDVIVPYNQITVNPADPSDRPKATAEQTKLVQTKFDESHGLGPKKEGTKKKSFIKKVGESIMQASDAEE